MIDIDKNPEQQLYLLEILSGFIDPRNIRQKIKKTSFKILNAIYLFTKHNEKLGRNHHYPGLQLIADTAKCGRRQVSDFVNSQEIQIFCDVKRNAFTSNEYFLKDWVYQWFRLFWRFGMMKHLHSKYEWWRSDFKKRVNNWLIPLVQAGHSIRDIYERTLNKLSTRKSLKGNATNPLKGNTIKPSGIHEALRGSKSIPESPLPFKEFQEIGDSLVRFSIKNGDIRMLMKTYDLHHHKRACNLMQLFKSRGMDVSSPVRVYQTCLNKTRTA